MHNNHGGGRPGAGRPAGSGKFGEPTVTLRVPESAKAEIVSYLSDRRARKEAVGGGQALPFSKLGGVVHAVSVHANPPKRSVRTGGVLVQAGAAVPLNEIEEDGCDFNELLVRNPEHTYVFTASGNSMTRAGIQDGSKLVVNTRIEPRHGHIVVAVILGEGTTVKRLYKTDVELALEPESYDDSHKRRVMTEHDHWSVWAVVTSAVNQFRV